MELTLGSKSRISIVPGYCEIEIAKDRHFGNALVTIRQGTNEIAFAMDGEELEQLAEMILEARSWEGLT